MLEWVAVSFSRGSSGPKDGTYVSCIGRRVLFHYCHLGSPTFVNTHFRLSYEASLIVQLVKNLPAVKETWVLSLGQEDLLEKEIATRSSILAWKLP